MSPATGRSRLRATTAATLSATLFLLISTPQYDSGRASASAVIATTVQNLSTPATVEDFGVSFVRAGLGNFQLFPGASHAAQSASLARLINQYRRAHGLEPIPVNRWLTYVAEYHVYDLENNNPDRGSCNLHSWSGEGAWTPCCYTSSHKRAKCMWDKPRELSNGAYRGNGYEIAAMNSGGMTSSGALEQWEGSSGHLSVIINRGIWADKKWKAMGAAVSAHYAVVWFGD